MKLQDITVILPTRNEKRNIVAFLNSLPDQLPLVVVDDSTDETPELIEIHRPKPTRVLCTPGTVTEARQRGAEMATSEWLLFTDADVIFAPDYFKRMTQWKACEVLYGSKHSKGQFAHYYRCFGSAQRLSHRLGIPAATGSNLLIRRQTLFAVGGFDLALNCNEDSEIVWRIKRHGYSVCHDPELIVYEIDHRRLQHGMLGKTLHSLLRNLLLYTGLMPERWRRHDWGYWSSPSRREKATGSQ